MLLALQRQTKGLIEMFDRKVYNRLLCLERNVRISSDTQWRIEDYETWLRKEGIAVPQPKTCRNDLRIYANLYDDVFYPSYAKVLKLDPSQSQDAISHFLGQAWVDSPLKPRLSSSVARCFLFAMHEKREIVFNYEELDLSNLLSFNLLKHVKGIPINVLPGLDSAYIVLWCKDGSLRHFNLARVVDKVVISENVSAHLYYAPYPEEEKKITLSLTAKHHKAKVVLERIARQFKGLVLFSGESKIECFIPEQKLLMIVNVLESFIRRTSERKKDVQRLKQTRQIAIDQLIDTTF